MYADLEGIISLQKNGSLSILEAVNISNALSNNAAGSGKVLNAVLLTVSIN